MTQLTEEQRATMRQQIAEAVKEIRQRQEVSISFFNDRLVRLLNDCASLLDSDSQAAAGNEVIDQQCSCHKFIHLHDGRCAVHGFVRKEADTAEGDGYASLASGEVVTQLRRVLGELERDDVLDSAAIPTARVLLRGVIGRGLTPDCSDAMTATAMRDKCVETVKAMRGNWHDQYVAADSSTREALVGKEMLFAQCCAARDIIKEIESLTLDQVKPGEM